MHYLATFFVALWIGGPLLGKTPSSYALKIQMPPEVHLHEPLSVFYKGRTIEFDGSCALIPESETTFTFSLIITPEITFASERNNILHMKRLPSQPFAWYDITFHPERKERWEIVKLAPEEASYKIPDHGIILLLNPEYIEEVVQPTARACSPSLHVIHLPTLVIDPTLTEDELHTAFTAARLAALDVQGIHKKPESRCLKRELSHCSIHHE